MVGQLGVGRGGEVVVLVRDLGVCTMAAGAIALEAIGRIAVPR